MKEKPGSWPSVSAPAATIAAAGAHGPGIGTTLDTRPRRLHQVCARVRHRGCPRVAHQRPCGAAGDARHQMIGVARARYARGTRRAVF